MARVKTARTTRARHKKILKQAKGYFGAKHYRFNAAARMNGTTYSKMIAGLKKANVTINRKMLAEIAVSDPKAFTEIAEIAKKA